MDILNKPPGPLPNPATAPESGSTPRTSERKRIPMSVPRQKLQVADIPGYHLHWALDSRIPSYLQAGYEYVNGEEVQLNQQSVGTDSTISGNQDLGTRVSVVAGVGQDGRAEHLVLMKLRLEFWTEDCRVLEQQNARRLEGIFRGEQIMGAEGVKSEDRNLMYVDRERSSFMKPLFQRPRKKAT